MAHYIPPHRRRATPPSHQPSTGTFSTPFHSPPLVPFQATLHSPPRVPFQATLHSPPRVPFQATLHSPPKEPFHSPHQKPPQADLPPGGPTGGSPGGTAGGPGGGSPGGPGGGAAGGPRQQPQPPRLVDILNTLFNVLTLIFTAAGAIVSSLSCQSANLVYVWECVALIIIVAILSMLYIWLRK